MPKCVVIEPAFDWTGDRAAAHAMGAHGDLRVPREGHDHAASGGAGAAARHLSRARSRPDPRAPPRARRHRGRAAPGAPGRQRAAPAPSAASSTTGATAPIGYFAPDVRFATGRLGQPGRRVQGDGAPLPRGGLEVLLDVVYNHTAEGESSRPDAPFRGIDNAAYYRLDPAIRDRYVDFTGCGNTVDVRPTPRCDLVLDSLRYWVEEMHVDGFRFDLAPVLGRRIRRSIRARRSSSVIAQDPVLSRREAHRRAVGPRARMAIRWARSRRAGRSGTASTATPCAASGGATPAPCGELASRLSGQQRPLRARRPRPAGQRQLRHLPRRVHPARPRELRAQAQRGQRRGQPGRRPTTT